MKLLTTMIAGSLMLLAFVALATPASAEGFACSSYRTVRTQGGEGTHEEYGRDCPVALNEGGHTVCIGYSEDTVNHYNDPNERSYTEYTEDCDRGVGGDALNMV